MGDNISKEDYAIMSDSIDQFVTVTGAMKRHLRSLRGLAETLPKTGTHAHECQRTQILEQLQAIEQSVSGLMLQDFECPSECNGKQSRRHTNDPICEPVKLVLVN